ncbi:hypothetical protein P5V15_003829 [Pogonomyrmex californicus]
MKQDASKRERERERKKEREERKAVSMRKYDEASERTYEYNEQRVKGTNMERKIETKSNCLLSQKTERGMKVNCANHSFAFHILADMYFHYDNFLVCLGERSKCKVS